MDRPTLTVADVVRRYGEVYRGVLSAAQRRVMTAITSCRTAALGGHVEQCDHCGHTRVWYNSCRNRHCPSCQSLARAAWIEDRTTDAPADGHPPASTDAPPSDGHPSPAPTTSQVLSSEIADKAAWMREYVASIADKEI